jgi:hypothetical protein
MRPAPAFESTMLMQAPRSPEAAERVLRGLAQRREACVRQVVCEAVGLDDYARLESGETEDLADTVREGLDAIVRAIGERRSLDSDDVAFLWPHIRRRTAAGVSEGDMLAVVRIFQRVLWDAIVELAGDDEDGRAAALILARPLIDYIDVLSDTVNKAYLEAGETIASYASHARLELMELLLSGAVPPPGATLNAARAAGLEGGAQVVVIVARPLPETVDRMGLQVAANTVARAAGGTVEPLAVARADEVVVVTALRGREPENVVRGIEAGHQRLLERGIALGIGASTVHEGLDRVPAAYAEACLALEHVRDSPGVVALCGLDVLEYLIVRAGDRTAWRLVPAAIRTFVEDDARQGGALSATLLAYVACDLSVKLAAQQLYVHPNTAHYRLAKIEARTGCEVRKLRDVQLLSTAIRLHRSNRSG